MPKETTTSLAKEIRLLREDFKEFVRDIRRTVVPRSEIELRLAEINKDIAKIHLEIIDHKKEAGVMEKELKAAIARRTWITHTLTAGFTALVVLAITYIFNDITKG
jgi:septal ring factor EnvC (AmiA/AmiB activator)